MWWFAVVTIYAQAGESDLSLARLLELSPTVVSHVVHGEDGLPVSITVIDAEMIEQSGAKTLHEVLNVYVPGFFMVEDQDDLIAGFRGIAPDNNSKVVFALNGHVLNTEWFWGPPDALLNGLDMGLIDHIQVIRGPGSALMGQGALLGAINVVTQKADASPQVRVRLGQNGLVLGSLGTGFERGNLRGFAFAQIGEYDGQPLAARGNATRSWEGVDGEYIYNSGNRLDRAQQAMGFGRVDIKGIQFQFLYVDQKRDLYNFRRDRNQVRQILASWMLNGEHDMSRFGLLKWSLGFDVDDYLLHAALGQVMGGVREYRTTLSSTWTGETGRWRWALGGDIKRFDMGRPNRDGNNFIVNRADETLIQDPNSNRQWVFNEQLDLKGVFGELAYGLSAQHMVFAGLRLDHHPFWGSEVSPRFGVLLNRNKALQCRFSYQQGFRGAVGVHYAGGFQGDGLLREDNFHLVEAATEGAIRLNPIEPERLKSLEAQLSWNDGKRWKTQATFFRNHYENVIGFGAFGAFNDVPSPDRIGSDDEGDWQGYWYFQNTPGTTALTGGELELTCQASKWEVAFSYSAVVVSSVEQDAYGSLYITPEEIGKHVRAFPEQTARLHMTWQSNGRLQASSHALWYGDWYTDGPKGNQDVMLNLVTTWRFRTSAKLHFNIYNLTNGSHYYPFTEAPVAATLDPRPGTPSVESRTYWLALEYDF
ncbi:MAG: TonB-dependent receptor plug domain-containing protein [Acidobacteria bacterium]|nr:TonB-dependent receptor plug domain-containing protein [Acidobacteriota bacterium]